MAIYGISWSVSGEFQCEAESEDEASRKFEQAWAADAVSSDRKPWARRPVELVSIDHED